MPSKHLTRKQIQEDNIRPVLERAAEWLAENIRLLAIVLGVVLLSVLAWWGWQSSQQSRQDAYQAKLGAALEIMQAPIGEAAQAIPGAPVSELKFDSEQERNTAAREALADLVEESDGTVGLFAQYYLAIMERRTGRTDDAITQLRGLSAEAGDTTIGMLATRQLAEILHQQGKTPEAIELWQKVLDSNNQQIPKDEVLRQMADACFENGEKKAALDFYLRLRTEFPTSQGLSDAQRRIDFLEAYFTDEKPESAPPEGA